MVKLYFDGDPPAIIYVRKVVINHEGGSESVGNYKSCYILEAIYAASF